MMQMRFTLTSKPILLLLSILVISLVATLSLFQPSTQQPIASCTLPELKSPHAGMVWVPAGQFTMGSTFYAEEAPRRTVSVPGFWMDRTEVTNKEFAEFVNATQYVTTAERPSKKGAAVFVVPTGNVDLSSASSWWRYADDANWRHPGGSTTSIERRENYPVVAITIEDAQAYAKWKGRALPTEAQWERAASDTAKERPEHEQPKNANTWQGLFPLVDTAEDGFSGSAPVGCFKPNELGLYDMIGNVWELTIDTYADRTPPTRVIKGGSFLCAPNYCIRYRPAARQPQEQDLGTNHVGFRTVLNAPPLN